MSFQLCLRCGRHEITGSYCSFCRTGGYNLADHEHAKDIGSHGCPLGSYLDPLDVDGGHVRHYLAERRPLPDGTPVRHHPRTQGYAAESDPPAPLRMSQALAQSAPTLAELPEPVTLPTRPAIAA